MKSSKFWAFTPPLYLFLSASIFGLALHTRHQTRRRWYLPLFLVFSILSLLSSKHFWFSRALMSLWDQSVTLNILHAISVLYIEQWQVPEHPPDKIASGSAGSREKWIWRFRTTYRLWGNPQLLRVRYTGNDDQPQQEIHDRGAQQMSTFIFLRAIKLPIYYYAHFHLVPMFFSETIGEIMPGDVGAEQQKLLRRLTELTAREAVVRSHTAVFWIWESLVYLDGANAVLAIFFVLAGLDQPADWPALFGSPTDTTSLRKFWSRYWHKLAIRPYKNYGRVVAGRLFQLEPRSVLFNAVVAFVIFGLSGVTHAVVAWHIGLKDWYLEIWWFVLNFFACSVETLCLSSIRTLAKQTGRSHQLREIEQSWFGSFVGYTWVFAFFFWSVPKWKYPRLELQAVALERFRKFIAKLEGTGG